MIWRLISVLVVLVPALLVIAIALYPEWSRLRRQRRRHSAELRALDEIVNRARR